MDTARRVQIVTLLLAVLILGAGLLLIDRPTSLDVAPIDLDHPVTDPGPEPDIAPEVEVDDPDG